MQLKRYILCILVFITATVSFTQNGDTLANRNISKKISTAPFANADSIKNLNTFLLNRQILAAHPYFNMTERGVAPAYVKRMVPKGKEIYFYILAGIALLFGGFKKVFDKYYHDLLSLFLRTSLKRHQIRQQLMQDSLPSLLLNIFYVITAAFYVSLLFKDLNIAPAFSFWKLYLYSFVGIACIYMGKYFILRSVGWMFQMKPLTDAYIFIIFLINKIIGIFLLPVIIMVALGSIELKTAVWTISWIVIAGLLLYRFIKAFGFVRKETYIRIFHFILYLFGFEILPIIVIYKAVSVFLH